MKITVGFLLPAYLSSTCPFPCPNGDPHTEAGQLWFR